MSADSMPLRCTFCNGSGDGQTVVTGRGGFVEACHGCKGAGRMNSIDNSASDSLNAEPADENDGLT